jgi:transcription antitermination factor NusG
VVPYVYPDHLFADEETRLAAPWWTCVRTRPRWEKKFARWLRATQMAHFLPTFSRSSMSYRKRRVTIEPLFPGFVFVQGACSKDDFLHSTSVVRLLKPGCDREATELASQLAAIWQAMMSGQPLAPVATLSAGQLVEILDGPLRGTTGRFQRMGRCGCLILAVSMLGVEVRVDLPPECRFEVIE